MPVSTTPIINRSGVRTPGRASQPSGFTLIEAMLAATVLSIAVLGISSLLSASTQQQRAMKSLATATDLARQLMEEIASKPLLEADGTRSPGPETGENSRFNYDNVDDYNGYSDDSTSLATAGGVIVLGDGQIFQRRVTVTYRATPSGPASSTGNFALVTVSVTTPDQQVISLYRVVTGASWAF